MSLLYTHTKRVSRFSPSLCSLGKTLTSSPFLQGRANFKAAVTPTVRKCSRWKTLIPNVAHTAGRRGNCLMYRGYPTAWEVSTRWGTWGSICSSLELRDNCSQQYRVKHTAMLWGSFRKVERISFHALKLKHTRRGWRGGEGGRILTGERRLEEGKGTFLFFPNKKIILVLLSSWVPSSHCSTKPLYNLDAQQDKQAVNAVNGEEDSDTQRTKPQLVHFCQGEETQLNASTMT